MFLSNPNQQTHLTPFRVDVQPFIQINVVCMNVNILQVILCKGVDNDTGM
tara:strand:+ start:172 stop:321 length:150 start_codon:yes stop_codon:yes gene_type:complete